MAGQANSVPCLLWPFWAIWRLITAVLGMAGRLIAAIVGMILMVTGLLLSATIIGAVVGIPMMIFGMLLVIRSLF